MRLPPGSACVVARPSKKESVTREELLPEESLYEAHELASVSA